MTNIKRLMYCTPKMSDNACSLHCYDTTDNNVKVHWHYTSPKCARPGRISGTLCLNAPFARVCENSYFYEMAHVIIKCRVTFGKEMFNDCIKPHSICMRLVLSTQEEFSLKRAHYGHSPLPKDNTSIYTFNTKYRAYLLMLHSFHVLLSARLGASSHDASYMAHIDKQKVFRKRAHIVDRR